MIAQTGNIFPMGPTKAYGGERIIFYLCEELHRLGHEVVFFGTAQNEVPTGVEHVVTMPIDAVEYDPHTPAVRRWEQAHGRKFDVFQCNYFGNKWDERAVEDWPYCELVWCSWCHTFDQLGGAFNTVSYSRTLQAEMKRTRRQTSMIHYGIPMGRYAVSDEPPLPYVVWIGKIEGGKGLEWAIDCAKAAGVRIVVMGPPYSSGHMQRAILPRIHDPAVVWLRGATDSMKARVFARATAFLSANVDGWTEAFGIVNIEALASGCPVIGWTRDGEQASAVLIDGVIQEGVNGYLMRYRSSANQDEWAHVVQEVGTLIQKCAKLNRQKVRESVVERFGAERMARRWLWFYEEVRTKRRVTSVEIPF